MKNLKRVALIKLILNCVPRWIGEKYDGIRYYWYSPSGTAYPFSFLVVFYFIILYFIVLFYNFNFLIFFDFMGRYSRHGRTLALLTPMTSLLPTTTSTDGEIWYVHVYVVSIVCMVYHCFSSNLFFVLFFCLFVASVGLGEDSSHMPLCSYQHQE